MVGVAGKWDKGILLGPVMGEDIEEGLGRPTPLQLFAAIAILEGIKMTGRTVLCIKETIVPGQSAKFVWPDERDVNGVLFEVGEGTTMLERAALAGQIRFLANVNMQGQLLEQAARRRAVGPSIAVPGARRLQ